MKIKTLMKRKIKFRGIKYCSDCKKFPCENIFDERGAMRASGCIVDEDDEIIDVTSEAFVSALRKFLSYDAKPSKWIMNNETLHLTKKISELSMPDDGYYLFGLPIEIDNDLKMGEVYLI